MEKVVQLNSVTSTYPVITIQSPVCVCYPRAYIQLPVLHIKIETNEVILYQTMVRGRNRELVHVATPRGHIHDPHHQWHCQEFPCSAGGTKSYTRHLFPGRRSTDWHKQSCAHQSWSGKWSVMIAAEFIPWHVTSAVPSYLSDRSRSTSSCNLEGGREIYVCDSFAYYYVALGVAGLLNHVSVSSMPCVEISGL